VCIYFEPLANTTAPTVLAPVNGLPLNPVPTVKTDELAKVIPAASAELILLFPEVKVTLPFIVPVAPVAK
jgi:hypothetical protein